MLNEPSIFSTEPYEQQPGNKTVTELEHEIIQLFLLLPRERQKAILAELWSEYRPYKPENKTRYSHLPY